MSREWKPGDVAMVTSVNGEVDVAIAVGVGDELNGWRISRADFWGPKYIKDVRPLVVIDPEDREHVEHIWPLMRDGLALRSRDNLQDALRSVVAPPKPEEPTGLGAVVEDAEGLAWVRFTVERFGSPWSSEDGSQPYSKISAVKVLSEGVTS